jgi:hypothetical protein
MQPPWTLLIGGLVVVGGLVVALTLLPPFDATTLIYIREGALEIKRGRLKPHAHEHLSDILRDSKVSRGFIAITANNRVSFSRSIPRALHQRLRNVLLNQ